MTEPLRVLRLDDSKDSAGDIPPGHRASEIADALLSAGTGRSVATTSRRPWPAPAFPDVLDRWLDSYQPDIVLFVISWYWTEWETVASRLQRYGVVGKAIGEIGGRASEADVIRTSWAFRQMRKLALNTIGGDPNFEPYALLATLQEAIRRAAQREDVVVAVASNPYASALDHGPRGKARAAARRAIIERGIRETCDRLRIPAVLPAQVPAAYHPSTYGPDRLHFSPRSHRIIGKLEGQAMV
ncbi:MAG TPA: hypothetical protein VFK32_01815, partial [Tepidiformaceae bacterium]|nr:hypothetical protein [Tepidiformaceae bacterium]